MRFKSRNHLRYKILHVFIYKTNAAISWIFDSLYYSYMFSIKKPYITRIIRLYMYISRIILIHFE